MTWGHPRAGGDSSQVRELLVRVQQIQATRGGAFAAILTVGSVVTWGDPDFGGNSSEVQEELVGVQQVQTTPYAFVAMVDNGFAVTWGDLNKCCGIDSSQLQEQLVAVKALSIARCMSRRSKRLWLLLPPSRATADGSVVTWGDPDCGGNSSKVQDELVGVQQVQATPYAFVAMVDNGFAVTWGDLNKCCGIDSSQLQEQLVAVRALSIAPSHCRAVSQKEHRPRMAQLVQVQKIQATMAAFAAILGDGSVVTCPRRKQQRSARRVGGRPAGPSHSVCLCRHGGQQCCGIDSSQGARPNGASKEPITLLLPS